MGADRPAAALAAVLLAAVLLARPARAEEVGVAFRATDPPLAEVLEAAREGDRLVLAEVFTKDCTWCRLLERDTFGAADVARALGPVICVRYDAEAGPGTVLAKRFLVRSFPTVLFLDAGGLEVDRIVGFLPPDRFAKEVARIRADDGTLRALRRAHEQEPASLPATTAYARRLVRSGELARAQGLLEEALAGASATPGARVTARLGLAEAALAALDEASALAVVEALTETDGDEPEAAAAWLLRVRLLERAGRQEEAVGLLPRARGSLRDPVDVAELESLAHGIHRSRMQKAVVAWGEAAEKAGDADQLVAAARAAAEDGVALGSALRWAERGAALAERSPGALEVLARVHRALRRPDLALAAAQEALGRTGTAKEGARAATPSLERLKALVAELEAEVRAAGPGGVPGAPR